MGLLMQRDGKSFEDQSDTLSPQFCAAMCSIVEGKAIPTQMCVLTPIKKISVTSKMEVVQCIQLANRWLAISFTGDSILKAHCGIHS